MYVHQLEHLDALITERKLQQSEISQKIDAWIYNEYGIYDFTDITDSYFGKENDDKTQLMLCRQIPSVRTEDIVCNIASRILGHNLLSLSFIDDSFSTDNHEKKSYLKIPWASHGRKGNLFYNTQPIFESDIESHVKKPLSSIKTKENIFGTYLHEYHFNLRKSVFPDTNQIGDASDLLRMYLKNSRTKPSYIYVLDKNNVYTKVHPNEVDLDTVKFRPAGEWYYPIYFSLFMTGKRILLETYDNELAQVSQAKILFEHTMRKVEKMTGMQPMVIKIPALDERMLSFPKKVIDNPCIIEEILDRSLLFSKTDSVKLFNSIANLVLEYS